MGRGLSLLLILSACSSSNGNVSDEKVEDSQETVQSDESKEESATTVQYTTITGEQVEIPAHPKRVVYLGSTLGDFLAMDIPIVGSNLVHATGKFYEGKTEGIIDVGNPGDLELILSLKPDLIINGYYKGIQTKVRHLRKLLLLFRSTQRFLIKNV